MVGVADCVRLARPRPAPRSGTVDALVAAEGECVVVLVHRKPVAVVEILGS